MYAAVGILIVGCGGALVVVGYLQHKAVLDFLRTGEARQQPSWPRSVTTVGVAGALLLSALIAVST